MPADDVADAAGASPPRSVRLVPAFDQHVVAATSHAAHLLPGQRRDRVYRSQGWLWAVLLVGGRMDGVWRRERRRRRLTATIEPFVKLPGWVRRGAEEAEGLARFIGGQLDLRWSA
jgi:Winged helix DNA-binding domain